LVLPEPKDGLVERLVDDISRDGPACLGQVAETLSALLHELRIVRRQLVKQDRDELVDIVDDLSLAGNAKYFI